MRSSSRASCALRESQRGVGQRWRRLVEQRGERGGGRLPLAVHREPWRTNRQRRGSATRSVALASNGVKRPARAPPCHREPASPRPHRRAPPPPPIVRAACLARPRAHCSPTATWRSRSSMPAHQYALPLDLRDPVGAAAEAKHAVRCDFREIGGREPFVVRQHTPTARRGGPPSTRTSIPWNAVHPHLGAGALPPRRDAAGLGTAEYFDRGPAEDPFRGLRRLHWQLTTRGEDGPHSGARGTPIDASPGSRLNSAGLVTSAEWRAVSASTSSSGYSIVRV